MAGIAKVNGNAITGEMVGKDINITSFAKSNITQAEMDAIIQALELTTTVLGIGTFVAGTTDNVNVIYEGPVATLGSHFGEGSTGVTSSATLHTVW